MRNRVLLMLGACTMVYLFAQDSEGMLRESENRCQQPRITNLAGLDEFHTEWNSTIQEFGAGMRRDFQELLADMKGAVRKYADSMGNRVRVAANRTNRSFETYERNLTSLRDRIPAGSNSADEVNRLIAEVRVGKNQIELGLDALPIIEEAQEEAEKWLNDYSALIINLMESGTTALETEINKQVQLHAASLARVQQSCPTNVKKKAVSRNNTTPQKTVKKTSSKKPAERLRSSNTNSSSIKKEIHRNTFTRIKPHCVVLDSPEVTSAKQMWSELELTVTESSQIENSLLRHRFNDDLAELKKLESGDFRAFGKTSDINALGQLVDIGYFIYRKTGKIAFLSLAYDRWSGRAYEITQNSGKLKKEMPFNIEVALNYCGEGSVAPVVQQGLYKHFRGRTRIENSEH